MQAFVTRSEDAPDLAGDTGFTRGSATLGNDLDPDRMNGARLDCSAFCIAQLGGARGGSAWRQHADDVAVKALDVTNGANNEVRQRALEHRGGDRGHDSLRSEPPLDESLGGRTPRRVRRAFARLQEPSDGLAVERLDVDIVDDHARIVLEERLDTSNDVRKLGEPCDIAEDRGSESLTVERLQTRLYDRRVWRVDGVTCADRGRRKSNGHELLRDLAAVRYDEDPWSIVKSRRGERRDVIDTERVVTPVAHAVTLHAVDDTPHRR